MLSTFLETIEGYIGWLNGFDLFLAICCSFKMCMYRYQCVYPQHKSVEFVVCMLQCLNRIGFQYEVHLGGMHTCWKKVFGGITMIAIWGHCLITYITT